MLHKKTIQNQLIKIGHGVVILIALFSLNSTPAMDEKETKRDPTKRHPITQEELDKHLRNYLLNTAIAMSASCPPTKPPTSKEFAPQEPQQISEEAFLIELDKIQKQLQSSSADRPSPSEALTALNKIRTQTMELLRTRQETLARTITAKTSSLTALDRRSAEWAQIFRNREEALEQECAQGAARIRESVTVLSDTPRTLGVSSPRSTDYLSLTNPDTHQIQATTPSGLQERSPSSHAFVTNPRATYSPSTRREIAASACPLPNGIRLGLPALILTPPPSPPVTSRKPASPQTNLSSRSRVTRFPDRSFMAAAAIPQAMHTPSIRREAILNAQERASTSDTNNRRQTEDAEIQRAPIPLHPPSPPVISQMPITPKITARASTLHQTNVSQVAASGQPPIQAFAVATALPPTSNTRCCTIL